MEIDVTQIVRNLQDEPFATGGVACPRCGHRDGKVEDMTLRHAALQALDAFGPNDRDGKDKFERFRIALLITDAKEVVELIPEDVVKIKELIGFIYRPVIVGRCWEMLK